ncbi:MAG: ABC transporter ATP-binding protein [Opitutales bacterium]|nr:ABC transporter ATP-binding protein [Opitutales bacterium]
MATILKVQNLTKLYGSKKGVSDISFDVGSGEIVGLLGPNGAGKTTTVECILGLRDPDSGRIEVNGIDSRSAPDTVRRMMGAQLQSTSLHDSITPRETTRLFASFYSPEPDTDQALKRFGLLPQADTPFRHLSGGQRQRLALTLAFLHNPGLVILDEPSAGLDPASRQDLLDCILAEKNKGAAILLCTHHLDEARRICDRVIVLDSGSTVAQGTPASLASFHSDTVSIRLRTAQYPNPLDLESIPGIVTVTPSADAWNLASSDPNQSLQEIGRLMEATGNRILEIHMEAVSLEAAFLRLTGHSKATAQSQPPKPDKTDTV